MLDGRAGTETETVGEYLEQSWLPAKEGRVEASTFDQYTWAVRRHIAPLLGAVRLRDLTAEVLDAWLLELVTVTPDTGKPRLGATSTRLVRKVLSMALEEAVQRGRLARNPVGLTQPPRPARRGQLVWTLEQARQFLASVGDHRLAPAFHLALVTGLRRGELLALRWSDVDLKGCQLTVVQQLAVEGGRPRMKQLKTEASQRIVTFGPAVAAALAEHRRRQDAEQSFVGPGWQDNDLLFCTPIGGWIDPNNFSRLMDTLVEQAGVPRITPKGLRHTAQSVGRVVVGDDKVMQERLGHADIGVTLNTYTHTVTKQHQEAGVQIDTVFGA